MIYLSNQTETIGEQRGEICPCYYCVIDSGAKQVFQFSCSNFKLKKLQKCKTLITNARNTLHFRSVAAVVTLVRVVDI